MSSVKSCSDDQDSSIGDRRASTADRVFQIAWLAVMAVSLYDASLLFKLRDVIQETERNPVGLWLIEVCGSVWLFIVLKVLGTLLVCTVLQILYRYRPRVGLTVVLVLAGLQLCLLSYLSL